MGITQKYLELLGADDEKVKEMIDKMSEKNAKELLKVIICKMNEDRRKNIKP